MTRGSRGLRATYRAVLALSGAYFYVSMPLLMIEMVVAGAGAILLVAVTGAIPIPLIFIIGLLVLGTVGGIVRSLTLRVRLEQPGERLDLADHPKLRQLLADVATSVGTRPADAVYLTPGTEIAVTERPGLWGSLRRKRGTRSLILGLGLFHGMTQLQLRSVLAHEHGHFRNADTAGGGFALQVRHSLFALIEQLARDGRADWLNPAWWFLRGYLRLYLGVSQGASRLQEVLADRWAVQAYGSRAFVASYRHVVARSVEVAAPSNADIAARIEAELAREPEAYDSHPSSQQRIAWAEAMAVEREARPADDAAVWELFTDREAIEHAVMASARPTRARLGP